MRSVEPAIVVLPVCRLRIAALVLLAWTFAAGAVMAQPVPATAPEALVRAATMLRLAEYVEWPGGVFADDQAPLRIGVTGADPVADALEQAVAGRRPGGRRVEVTRLLSGDSADGLQMLYLGAGSGRRGSQAVRTDAPVLVIAEGRPARGAAIILVRVDGRIRFDVDLAAARARGLRISARLLRVARRVEGAQR